MPWRLWLLVVGSRCLDSSLDSWVGLGSMGLGADCNSHSSRNSNSIRSNHSSSYSHSSHNTKSDMSVYAYSKSYSKFYSKSTNSIYANACN
jgi:hypothetical protein